MNFSEVSNEKINSEDEVIKTMDNFANRIPVMIERLEIINKGIELEPLSKLILEINENSKILCNLGKEILNYDKELIKKNQEEYEKNFKEITEISKKALCRKNEFYNYLDKILLGLVFFTILFNLGIGYYYKKSLDKVNEKNSRIHNILLKEEKYWIDKENFQVYTEHVKK